MSITVYRGSSFAGMTRQTNSGLVEFVNATTAADIVYKPLIGHQQAAKRPYFVTATRRRYSTLESAATAVLKHRGITMPSRAQLLAAFGPCGK